MANEGSTPTHDHGHDHHQNDQLIRVEAFGSQTRKLETPIRALVTKPKVDKSMEDKGTYVLVVEGIDCQSDEPVRFDVYVAKPRQGDEAGTPELGQFAGSLVDLARNSTAKRSLDLGISYLMKEIGATDCGELVVTLKPRSGQVSVGGVRLEYVSHDD